MARTGASLGDSTIPPDYQSPGEAAENKRNVFHIYFDFLAIDDDDGNVQNASSSFIIHQAADPTPGQGRITRNSKRLDYYFRILSTKPYL